MQPLVTMQGMRQFVFVKLVEKTALLNAYL